VRQQRKMEQRAERERARIRLEERSARMRGENAALGDEAAGGKVSVKEAVAVCSSVGAGARVPVVRVCVCACLRAYVCVLALGRGPLCRCASRRVLCL